MIPEIGHFALIVALLLSFALAIVPLVGNATRNQLWLSTAKPLAMGIFTMMTVSLIALTLSFLHDDFSVKYVASHGNTLLPTMYKISAVWGAHEGSLLLWAFMLAAWTAAVAYYSKTLPDDVVARVLSILGFVSIGFLLFMIFTSNPFDRIFPPLPEGGELNPLLQDPGLAIHPPLLYMGYVGFSVAFAFAIAALLGGKLDAVWARWSRPWTTIAWVFLTLGIMLGSWWAYSELGWGGWWFWDPVENASLLPWLAGTALMHSLSVTEKRGAFKSWTVLLAISAFSLSLLGTFLVRSGVLTSVHAFASDPTRGTFILAFLVIVIGGSLLLYAWRAPSIMGGGNFTLLSRETFLLGNNSLLAVFTMMVLFGTLAPLIYEAMAWGKISVGFPWFNRMFLLITPFLALLMGIGPLLRWKTTESGWLLSQLKIAIILTLLIGVITLIPSVMTRNWSVTIGAMAAVWVLVVHIESLRQRISNRGGLSKITSDLVSGQRSYYGMWLAHIGVVFFIIGITAVTNFEIEKDVRMSPGQTIELAGYHFQFNGVTTVQGANYKAQQGHIALSRDGDPIGELTPQKRVYTVQTRPMTEASINIAWNEDVYASLGEPLDNNDWSLRLYYKPFVRWIWLGAILMALGGLLAVTDRRYRILKKSEAIA